jgi:hypothetical protein
MLRKILIFPTWDINSTFVYVCHFKRKQFVYWAFFYFDSKTSSQTKTGFHIFNHFEAFFASP